MSNVHDPDTGEFRKDVKIVHLKVLSDDPEDVEKIYSEFQALFKRTSLNKEYILIATGPKYELHLDTVQNFINLLGKESAVLSKVEDLDKLINSLKRARALRWKQADAARRK